MNARILIAATPDGVAVMERILGRQHEFVVVTTLRDALMKLGEQKFDLVLVGVHFDESRMFELLRAYSKIPENCESPIICFCTLDTPLTRTMHQTIDATTKALGAWMYLDQSEYSVDKDPDADIRRLLERCLTGEARRKTQEVRVESLRQREELQHLREALEGYEWSENLEDRVLELRKNLAAALLELCELRVDSVTQQEQIAISEDRKDIVSEAVQSAEKGATRDERQILLEETKQKVREVEIGEREEAKRTEGRRKPVDEEVSDFDYSTNIQGLETPGEEHSR